MRRVSNLYNKINDINIIMDMYDNTVRKNTKNKNKIYKFNDYYTENISNIKKIIDNKHYTPGEYNVFLIKEPKVRIIMSQSITDKVINHLVAKYFLVNVFDKTFIDSNVATRIGRGTNSGLKLTKKYFNIMKNKYDKFYILKFDISKYFYNIDHDIVKELIKDKIKDKDVLNIINNIIDSTDSKYVNECIKKLKEKEIEQIKKSNISNKEEKIKEINEIPYYNNNKGFPIGNMTSQIIAVLYLNELDHYIFEGLGIKYYVRYMDDGIIFHQDKEYLKHCLRKIELCLDKYMLKLNKKTRIYSNRDIIEFLGFKFFLKNKRIIMKVNDKTKKKFIKKIKNSSKKEALNSYKGHFKYGNCKGLVNKYLRTYR